MYSKIIVYLIALMYIKEMCTHQRRQIRWLTSDWQERRLHKPQIKAAFKFANKATRNDSFSLSTSHVYSDLRKCEAAKPLATIHFAKQALKRKIGCFDIRFGRLWASKPFCFCPRDKNKTADSRFRNSSRFCPRACPKLLCEDARRDSAARQSKPTTKQKLTGMTL